MNFQKLILTKKKLEINHKEIVHINSANELKNFNYAIIIFDIELKSEIKKYPNLYRIAILDDKNSSDYSQFEDFIYIENIQHIYNNIDLITIKYIKSIIDKEFLLFNDNTNFNQSISQMLTISETLFGIRFSLLINNKIILGNYSDIESITESTIESLKNNNNYIIKFNGYSIISLDKKLNELKEEEKYFLEKLKIFIEMLFFNNTIVTQTIGAIDVLNSIHDELILLFSQNGKLLNIFGNTSILQKYNLSKENLVGKFYYEIFYKELYEKHMSKIKSIFETKKNFSTIEQINFGNKKTWHNIQLQPLINDKKSTEAILIRLREITELKETQNKYIDSKNFIQTLLYSIGDAIVVTNTDYKIIDFNSNFKTLFNYNNEKILGTTLETIFQNIETYKTITNNIINKLKLLKKEINYATLKTKTDKLLECEIITTLYITKTEENIVFIIKDITKQKDMEQSLIRQTKELTKVNTNLENARIYQDKIFNSVADVILVLDEFNTIIDSNNSIKPMLGYEKRELIGRKFNDLFAKENLFNDLIPDIAFQDIQKNMKSDVTLLKKDGSGILANINIQKKNVKDETISSVVVIRDITNNRLSELRAKASDTKFRSLFYSVKEIIIILDSNFKIVQVNPYTFTHIGYLTNELINKEFDFLVNESSKEKFKNFKNELISNDIARDEIEINTKNGNIITTDFSASSFYIDSGLKNKSFVFLLNDITELKRVNKLKDEFVSIVSHELRSPLTSIIGSLGLIQAGIAGEIPTKAKSLIEISKKNADRLKNVINDILDIQKIESGKMDFNYSIENLRELIKQVYDANLGFAKKFNKEIEIIDEIPNIFLRIDEAKFYQIMTNLISNAIKYSSETSKIMLSFKESNDQIKISVINNGPTIPEEFQDKIFTKFAQAESYLTRKQEGTGLGLNITKQFVEKMNGVISFESFNNKTEFFIIFPKFDKEGDK